MKSHGTLLSLKSDYSGAIKVRPRWPYSRVLVSPEAFESLERAQSLLSPDLQLVLTRGLEPGGWLLKRFHWLGRKLGASVFLILYPTRSHERAEIFSANGHDKDGNHLDVSIIHAGVQKRFLPFGVLTSSSLVDASKEAESVVLDTIYKALRSVGFSVHSNPTESLQIHCDLV